MNRLKHLSLCDKIFTAILVLTIFLSFYNLGTATFSNDGQFWYTRTENFVQAVKKQEWTKTFQNPKPGVTVMWLSGFSMETFLTLYEKVYKFRPLTYTYETFPYINFAVLAPLVTINIVAIAILYIVLKRLLKEEIALVAVIILVSQPFFIGISRIFHADGVVTSFMTISAILAIYFLNNKKEQKYLIIISGLVAGLAVLSKSSALFLLPYTTLIFLIDYLFKRRSLKFYLINYFLWMALFAGTFFVAFPAMWIKPVITLQRVFIEEGGLFLDEEAAKDGTDKALSYYAQPMFQVFTPVLLGMIALGIVFIVQNRKKPERNEKITLIMTAAYIIFYLLQMSLAKQKMERYLLPALPFMAVFGAYGAEFILKYIKQLSFKKLVFILIPLSYVFILYFFPHYLIYASEKGKDQYACSLCSKIGDYLNSQPNAGDLKIISVSNKIHRLRPFVRGKVYTTGETLPYGWTPEYLVAAKSEDIPVEYGYCKLDQSIGFRNVEYWDVYKCK